MKYQDYQDDEKDETPTCIKDLFLLAGNLVGSSYNYTCEEQALTGSRISIPGFFGTGFCQIPGSRDFSGRDFPIFLIPGFKGNFSGYFGIFIFASFPCQIRSLSSNQYPENDHNSISKRSSTLKQHALKNHQSDQCLAIFIISLL